MAGKKRLLDCARNFLWTSDEKEESVPTDPPASATPPPEPAKPGAAMAVGQADDLLRASITKEISTGTPKLDLLLGHMQALEGVIGDFSQRLRAAMAVAKVPTEELLAEIETRRQLLAEHVDQHVRRAGQIEQELNQKLEQEIADKNAAVSQAEADIARLQGEIVAAKARLGELQSGVTPEQARLATLRATYAATTGLMRDELDDLWNEVNRPQIPKS